MEHLKENKNRVLKEYTAKFTLRGLHAMALTVRIHVQTQVALYKFFPWLGRISGLKQLLHFCLGDIDGTGCCFSAFRGGANALDKLGRVQGGTSTFLPRHSQLSALSLAALGVTEGKSHAHTYGRLGRGDSDFYLTLVICLTRMRGCLSSQSTS